MFFEKRIEAIILDHIDNGIKNGFLLKILSSDTLNYVIAKGIQKMDSSNRAHCKIGTIAELEILESSSLIKTLILKKAHSLYDLENNFESNSLFFKRLAHIFSYVDKQSNLFYKHYKNCYKYFFDTKYQLKALCWIFYKLIAQKGIFFNHNRCAKCGKNTNICYIELNDGGFLCNNETSAKMRLSILKSFFLVSKNIEQYLLVEPNDNEIIFSILDNFVKNNT